MPSGKVVEGGVGGEVGERESDFRVPWNELPVVADDPAEGSDIGPCSR